MSILADVWLTYPIRMKCDICKYNIYAFPVNTVKSYERGLRASQESMVKYKLRILSRLEGKQVPMVEPQALKRALER